MCLNRTWKIAGHGTMTRMESILLSQYKVLCQENATQDKEKYKLILDKRIPLKLSTFAWEALRGRKHRSSFVLLQSNVDVMGNIARVVGCALRSATKRYSGTKRNLK
ncbi:hypothetical protein SLEP1_g5449 [Rubroshorea leprosula]|uniref:Uncharacterized protein n=1 Tax=Rubroshorea leprosula TaxID=152421 RepID=A0AAV5HS92_9ROSI|nr:hypothetical protein SLEP1_g5449 [Rubroshorea leprosula]